MDSFRDHWKVLLPLTEELLTCSTLQEARNTAISLARKLTGRTKVLAFVNQSSSGFVFNENEVEIISAGSLDLACRSIACSSERIAAIIVEPTIGSDYGHKKFLRKVRELCSAEGALLIWDECTEASLVGSRQAFFGVVPDFTCLTVHSQEDHFFFFLQRSATL